MSRFVYGSLLAPEVLDALLGRVPDRTPATLPGFVRRRIKDAVFPAIPYCLDLTGAARLEADAAVIEVFRPKPK